MSFMLDSSVQDDLWNQLFSPLAFQRLFWLVHFFLFRWWSQSGPNNGPSHTERVMKEFDNFRWFQSTIHRVWRGKSPMNIFISCGFSSMKFYIDLVSVHVPTKADLHWSAVYELFSGMHIHMLLLSLAKHNNRMCEAILPCFLEDSTNLIQLASCFENCTSSVVWCVSMSAHSAD